MGEESEKEYIYISTEYFVVQLKHIVNQLYFNKN